MVVSHRLTFPLLAGRNGMKLSHRLNTLCTCAERDSTGTELWCHTNQSKHSWKKGVYKIQHKWTNRINENNNKKTKNTHTHQQTLKKKKNILAALSLGTAATLVITQYVNDCIVVCVSLLLQQPPSTVRTTPPKQQNVCEQTTYILGAYTPAKISRLSLGRAWNSAFTLGHPGTEASRTCTQPGFVSGPNVAGFSLNIIKCHFQKSSSQGPFTTQHSIKWLLFSFCFSWQHPSLAQIADVNALACAEPESRRV